MLDEEVRIRPAEPEEAEILSEIAWRSREYWEYPAEMMNQFHDFSTITYEFVENNPNSNLAQRCCDFQLLEEKCKEYTKMISTKSFQELEYDEIEKQEVTSYFQKWRKYMEYHYFTIEDIEM